MWIPLGSVDRVARGSVASSVEGQSRGSDESERAVVVVRSSSVGREGGVRVVGPKPARLARAPLPTTKSIAPPVRVLVWLELDNGSSPLSKSCPSSALPCPCARRVACRAKESRELASRSTPRSLAWPDPRIQKSMTTEDQMRCKGSDPIPPTGPQHRRQRQRDGLARAGQDVARHEAGPTGARAVMAGGVVEDAKEERVEERARRRDCASQRSVVVSGGVWTDSS